MLFKNKGAKMIKEERKGKELVGENILIIGPAVLERMGEANHQEVDTVGWG